MKCDKCGKPVPENNDAVMLDFIATNNWLLIGAQSRHLFPTESCEGSPSRVRAIYSDTVYQKAYEMLRRRTVTNDKDAQNDTDKRS